MPNIVRVVSAGDLIRLPDSPIQCFQVYWVTKDGREDWFHIFAKDELNAWQKAEKQLKEKENGRSLTDD